MTETEKRQFEVKLSIDLFIEAEDIAEASKKLQNLITVNDEPGTGIYIQDWGCTPFKEIKDRGPA